MKLREISSQEHDRLTNRDDAMAVEVFGMDAAQGRLHFAMATPALANLPARRYI